MAMRYLSEGREARRVDPDDPERLRDLAEWCRGRVIDDDPEYILVMPTPIPNEVVRVKPWSWIIQDREGVFFVHADHDWRPVVDPWPWFVATSGHAVTDAPGDV